MYSAETDNPIKHLLRNVWIKVITAKKLGTSGPSRDANVTAIIHHSNALAVVNRFPTPLRTMPYMVTPNKIIAAAPITLPRMTLTGDSAKASAHTKCSAERDNVIIFRLTVGLFGTKVMPGMMLAKVMPGMMLAPMKAEITKVGTVGPFHETNKKKQIVETKPNIAPKNGFADVLSSAYTAKPKKHGAPMAQLTVCCGQEYLKTSSILNVAIGLMRYPVASARK